MWSNNDKTHKRDPLLPLCLDTSDIFCFTFHNYELQWENWGSEKYKCNVPRCCNPELCSQTLIKVQLFFFLSFQFVADWMFCKIQVIIELLEKMKLKKAMKKISLICNNFPNYSQFCTILSQTGKQFADWYWLWNHILISTDLYPSVEDPRDTVCIPVWDWPCWKNRPTTWLAQLHV